MFLFPKYSFWLQIELKKICSFYDISVINKIFLTIYVESTDWNKGE